MKTNNSVETALVTDIQRFCMHDGPGVRTTVFFKGCPLRCKWCHNPETQSLSPEILFSSNQCLLCGACNVVCENSAHNLTSSHVFNRSLCALCGKCVEICPANALSLSGKQMTIDEILLEVEKDRVFYGMNGGLTISGGEPTMQSKALFSLLDKAKQSKISTAVETCGVFSEIIIDNLCKLTDLFLFDIKDTNPTQLLENTGADLKKVIDNLHFIDDAGGETVLRCILIPDVNMTNEHCHNLIELYKSLKNCQYIELLPYHPYGESKAVQLGREQLISYKIPIREEIMSFGESLIAHDVPVKMFGSKNN